MGDVVKFPARRDVAPEVSELIEQQTKKAAYWVRRWSEISRCLCDADAEHMEPNLVQDASDYVHQWLSERNRTALKMRGF
jgi:hypothetical protein